MNFGISDKLYFFLQNERILRGKKHTALFQTYNWEKSSFFSTHSYMYLHRYKQIRGRGGMYTPPPGQIGLSIENAPQPPPPLIWPRPKGMKRNCPIEIPEQRAGW